MIEELSFEAEGDAIGIGKVLALAGLAKSHGEGMRLVKGGAVHVDGEVVKDEKARFLKGATHLLRVGSKNRRFLRVTIK